MFGFKEVREHKREERNLGFDPDVLIKIDENKRRTQEYVRQAQKLADETWAMYMADVLIER